MAVWWKTDRLYALILGEVRALWDDLARAGLQGSRPPEALRVEEQNDDGNGPDARAPARHVWYLDAEGARLVPGLRSEAFDPGAIRGAFFQFGLVRFQINGDRSQVAFNCQFGPGSSREFVLDVVGSGAELALCASAGTRGAGAS